MIDVMEGIGEEARRRSLDGGNTERRLGAVGGANRLELGRRALLSVAFSAAPKVEDGRR